MFEKPLDKPPLIRYNEYRYARVAELADAHV